MHEPKPDSDFFVDLAGQLASVNDRAILVYSPIVNDIIESSSADRRLIESTLDGLLGFAGSERGLILFKELCRHYWDLDPVATATYIDAYREMWDEDVNNP